MAEEEGQEVIFTENTAPDREIWDEKGGLIKKGAAEIAERDQDHVPEVKVLTTLGMFAVPVTAETTIGEIRQKVQEWKPEYSLEQIELVCKDKDALGAVVQQDVQAEGRRRDGGVVVERLGHSPAHDAGGFVDKGEERGDRGVGEHLLEDARGVEVRRLELPGPPVSSPNRSLSPSSCEARRAMAEEEGQEVIFTENTAPDREIWDEKGGLIKKGAAEIAERDQDHVPEVKVLTTLGMFAVPVTAETTIGEIRQKVQEWKPEYSLEQIELVCKDKDAWGPLFNKTSRPRDDDETVESLWSDWDIPRRMMQVALWIKEKNEETGEWESTFWKMLEESKCDDWSFQGHTI
eukprot:CAMPEP_0176040104 /NCGR_PEP_ID=MMETSP0120_2-20121206/19884_1 /TAXON_ID=160619 /ORGANISM="Kryptoperidinium foliaceum, Strain CCMP 1326" /LENGTH=347 /DNA_ID=CAMNT_0017373501 /DNA_START=75 /DNA_END=1117 /DNA_ORIENTATION=+